MREKLGSFATLHVAQISTDRLMEKNLSLNEKCCLLSLKQLYLSQLLSLMLV
jgi:hypothetical protein